MQSRRNDVDTITLHLHFQTDQNAQRYRIPQPIERHVFVPNTAKPRALRPPINGNPPNAPTPYNRASSTTTMRLVGQRFHGQRPVHQPAGQPHPSSNPRRQPGPCSSPRRRPSPASSPRRSS